MRRRTEKPINPSSENWKCLSPRDISREETTPGKNRSTIERAQQIAAHESPPTTKLYDRTHDQLTLDEIERIRI